MKEENLKQYLFLGDKNAIVISLDTFLYKCKRKRERNFKPFFVCAVIPSDSSILDHAADYIQILASISKHHHPVIRGKKTHLQEGELFPFGYHSDRTSSTYSRYVRTKYSLQNHIEWETFSKGMENICSHYSTMMKYYFPMLTSIYYGIQKEYNSPYIGTSYTSTIFASYNYSSAIHVDKRDATYAFGVWFDFGDGVNANSTFCFPEYRVALKLQHGLCALWNSEQALHCTTKSSPHTNLRIGTVIQMNKTINTRAKLL